MAADQIIEPTAAQRALIDAQRLTPQSTAYTVAEYAELRGALSAEALVSALGQTVAVVEASRLRERIDARGLQVLSSETVPIDVIDLRRDPDAQHSARRLMDGDLATPLSLVHDPWTRHIVFMIGDDHLIWYHRAHHAALDGYGFALFAHRLAAHLDEAAGGTSVSAPRHRLSDLVNDEETYRNSSQRACDRAFWDDLLHDAEAVTLSDARAQLPSGPARRVSRTLPLYPSVDGLGGPGFVALAIASLAVVTSRFTRSSRPLIGLPVSARYTAAARTVPSALLNTIPLPVDVGSGTAGELVHQVADTLRTVLPHARYRAEDLRRERGLAGADRRLFGPSLNVMAFDHPTHLGGSAVQMHNLSAGPVDDLSVELYVHAAGGTVVLCVDGHPDRYETTELESIATGFERVMGELSARPESSLLEIGAEVVHLHAPSETTAPTWAESFSSQVASGPDAPAVVLASRTPPRTLSYRELDELLRSRAEALLAGPETVILPDERSEAVFTALAARMAGRPFAALPAARRNAPRAQLHRLLDDGDPHATAAVVFTSGSTGVPKAVPIPAHGFDLFVHQAGKIYGVDPSDRVLQFTPMSADTSIEEIFVTLAHGATLVIVDEEDRSGVHALLATVERAEVSVLDLPTAVWHELAFAVAAGVPVPSCLGRVIVGGEPLASSRVAGWNRNAPAVRVINTYGPSEASIVTTSTVASASSERPVIPLGDPLPGAGIILLRDQIAPGGSAAGELCVYGPLVSRGYLGGQRTNVFSELVIAGNREMLFRTGDLVEVDDGGALHWLARGDDVVKISGQRVQLKEVEARLLAVRGVVEAAVMYTRSRDGAAVLQAFLMVAPDGPDAAEVRGELSLSLPPHAVPVIARFGTERLPRTPSGKIDRRSLTSVSAPMSYRDELTTIVANLVAQVTGAPRVRGEDDFFAIGGSSMQTIVLANRLSARLGREVGVETIFAFPVVADLAAALRGGEAPVSIDQAERDARELDAPRPLPARHRAGVRHVLVTGATGHLGRRIVADLVTREDIRVSVTVRPGSTVDFPAGVQRISADLSRVGAGLSDDDRAAILDDVTDIIHAAADVSVLRSYAGVRQTNVLGTLEVLRLCRSDTRLLFLSTVGAAGVAGGPGYVQSKRVGENLVARFRGGGGRRATVVRLGRIAGDRDGAGINPDDTLVRVLAAARQLGCLPRVPQGEPVVCADDLAAEIVNLLLGEDAPPLLTVEPDVLTTPEDAVRAAGLELSVLDLSQWRRRLDRLPDPDRMLIAGWCEAQASVRSAGEEGLRACRGPSSAALRSLALGV